MFWSQVGVLKLFELFHELSLSTLYINVLSHCSILGVEFQCYTSHFIEPYAHAGTCDRFWTNATLAGGEEQRHEPGR